MTSKHKLNTPLKRKVFVAMSGGVDSSVAAALLLREGYEVTGAFMKQWDSTHSGGEIRNPKTCPELAEGSEIRNLDVCTWKQDRRDALRVAATLGIPLITLDFEREYRQWVSDYMFREYKAGRTPNPDVLCNKYIKFGVWLEKARELGFDYLATGHYAQIMKTQKHKNTKTQYLLLQARDKDKDQTYFLHQLTQKQLTNALFPIGGYLKSEVRKLARQFHLPTAEREESMGICFVGEVPMKEFLLQKIKSKKGKAVTTFGEVVGQHDGLSFYTIGQRSGLFLSSRANPERMKRVEGGDGNSRPLYVVDKRFETNELVVGHEDDPALYRKEVAVGDVNWIAGPVFVPTVVGTAPGRRPPMESFARQVVSFPLKCQVRLRHRQALQTSAIRLQTPAKSRSPKSEVRIAFKTPQRAVTPGQFAVFYKRGVCLGGGVIL